MRMLPYRHRSSWQLGCRISVPLYCTVQWQQFGVHNILPLNLVHSLSLAILLMLSSILNDSKDDINYIMMKTRKNISVFCIRWMIQNKHCTFAEPICCCPLLVLIFIIRGIADNDFWKLDYCNLSYILIIYLIMINIEKIEYVGYTESIWKHIKKEESSLLSIHSFSTCVGACMRVRAWAWASIL